MPSLQRKKYEDTSDLKIDRQLRMLFDSTPEFKVCMLNHRGRIVGWSASAERLTGYAAHEVMGKRYSSFISKDEQRRDVLIKALAIAASKGIFTADGVRVRKDGSHFWARTVVTPMKEKDGNTKFFVLITRNISEERLSAQKREEYIGIASHELKNPITTLSLYSELLAKRLELENDKENLHMLRDIQGQASRLVGLVDDLLIVSSIEGGSLRLRKEVFNPNTFIRTLVRDFQLSTRTHKVICSGALKHFVRADKDRVRQVMINLLTNAVKYSAGAKKVFVHIERMKNKCVISVRDLGLGIAKKDQRDIFTRYFRTADVEAGNVAGVGLGLYISKEIIKKHRERLWVKSVVGKGTTFYFTLSLT
jgi:PAS domain S-box-containing protein